VLLAVAKLTNVTVITNCLLLQYITHTQRYTSLPAAVGLLWTAHVAQENLTARTADTTTVLLTISGYILYYKVCQYPYNS